MTIRAGNVRFAVHSGRGKDSALETIYRNRRLTDKEKRRNFDAPVARQS
jgi:hypothetical protein